MIDEEIQLHLEKIQEYRRDAFALLGMAHFNYNSITLERQVLDKINEGREEQAQEILGVLKRLLTGNPACSDLSDLAVLLVKYDEAMANGLSTVIGFELEDKDRRRDADKI